MQDTITPRLRPDVKLKRFGEFEGDDRFIVAVDDRHFVVSATIAAVLEASRGETTLAAVAERASATAGRGLSPEAASEVLSAPVLSVCFHVPENRAEPECPVRLRRRLISAETLRPILAPLCLLFTRPVAVAIITALVVVELLVAGQAAASVPQSLSGAQIICTAALTILGVVVHELGHLTACARFGARYGGIGLGVYWCMPVFYAEVSGAWMLPRLQRAIVDAGGIYFQCGYVLALGAAYLASDAAPFLAAMAWSHFLMLHTLNPVLKYDGYWLLTDLAGISNLHDQIRTGTRHLCHAACGRPGAQWPGHKLFALLAAFGAIATGYFSYVFTALGTSIGQGVGEVSRHWSARAGTPFGTWHVVGECAVLALLIVMALSLAFLFARSIHQIGRNPQA